MCWGGAGWACAPSLESLRVASNIRHADFAADHIAVVPVASRIDDNLLNGDNLAYLSTVLATSIGRRWPKLTPAFPRRTAQAAKQHYPELQADFEAGDQLDAVRIALVAKSLGARYLVLTRIDNYMTQRSHEERPVRQLNPDEANRTGHLLSRYLGTLVATMWIWDAKAKQPIWEARHQVSDATYTTEAQWEAQLDVTTGAPTAARGTGNNGGRDAHEQAKDAANAEGTDAQHTAATRPLAPTPSHLAAQVFAAFLDHWPK